MIVDDKEYLDFSRVPESKGIPKRVMLIGVIGIIGVFIMGYLSSFMSGFGHCSNTTAAAACPNTNTMWPSEKTQRMPLPPPPQANQ